MDFDIKGNYEFLMDSKAEAECGLQDNLTLAEAHCMTKPMIVDEAEDPAGCCTKLDRIWWCGHSETVWTRCAKNPADDGNAHQIVRHIWLPGDRVCDSCGSESPMEDSFGDLGWYSSLNLTADWEQIVDDGLTAQPLSKSTEYDDAPAALEAQEENPVATTQAEMRKQVAAAHLEEARLRVRCMFQPTPGLWHPQEIASRTVTLSRYAMHTPSRRLPLFPPMVTTLPLRGYRVSKGNRRPKKRLPTENLPFRGQLKAPYNPPIAQMVAPQDLPVDGAVMDKSDVLTGMMRTRMQGRHPRRNEINMSASWWAASLISGELKLVWPRMEELRRGGCTCCCHEIVPEEG